MSINVNAFAAMEAGNKLEPFQYEMGQLGPQDVDIAVKHCGVCHSDLSMMKNDWEMSTYPLVPGHEVIGIVDSIGTDVSTLTVGDTVGLGWHSGYDLSCPQCMSGDHNLCAAATGTIVGRHGGFADRVRAQEASVVKLPEGLAAADAGPLFCGGITVFNPLVQYDVSPMSRVGVIGVGGLGHLAIQFAAAWGCEVTAFTSTAAKADEARNLGARHIVNSRSDTEIEAAAGSLDLILSTVNVTLDWNAYLSTLRPHGRLHFLGAAAEPIVFPVTSLMFGQKSISSSPVGSPATIENMLDFAARHSISPTTEHFAMPDVNQAMQHLEAGKARYRIVLDV